MHSDTVDLSATQVQANGLVTPDAASLASRVTAPARVSQDASSAASMASSSSMLTSGSTAQHAPLPPKPTQACILPSQLDIALL